MRLKSIQAIVEALNASQVRYLVVGGLAVVAHGYLRFTNDLDLVLQLQPDNIKRAFEALATLEYRPVIPVTGDQFADVVTREGWIRDKGMRVLQLWSDQHRETPIDLFVAEPFDFDAEYAAALLKTLSGGVEVRVASLRALIGMKETAGRPIDRIDVEQLRMRLEDNEA